MDNLLYIAVLPVVLLLIYIYKKDTHKEPGNVLAKIFFFGALTVIPAGILEIILNPFFPTDYYESLGKLFVSVLIGVALIEELVKWLVIKLIIYKNEHFDETFDGIVYAVFSSLGFACIENILYVFTMGPGTAVLRAVTAVPLHACTGIVMGYFIGKAKLCAKNNKSQETTNIILSLLIPTVIHAIYDFLVFTKRMDFIIIWIGFVIAIYIICFILVKSSTKLNISTSDTPVEEKTQTINQPIEKTKGIYCTNCGQKIEETNFCPYCGKKNDYL